jgi:hypothetical protein
VFIDSQPKTDGKHKNEISNIVEVNKHVVIEGTFLLIALVIARITLNVIVRQMSLNVQSKTC